MSAVDHLAQHQLSLYRSRDGYGVSDYDLVRDVRPGDPNSLAHRNPSGTVVGRMQTQTTPATSTTLYPATGGTGKGAMGVSKAEFSDHEAHNQGFSELAHRWETNRGEQHPPFSETQGRLFLHSHNPASAELSGLFMDRSVRHLAGPLIGVAQNAARQETQRDLETPGSLSMYSSRLVSKMKGRGLVAEDAEDETTNDYDFHSSSPAYDQNIYGQQVSAQEWNQGRSTMRSMLRRDRPARPQGTQQSLFE